MKWKFWKSWKTWFGQTEERKISSDVEKTNEISSDVALNNQEDADDASRAVIPTVYITESLLERTRALLASFAKNRHSEGVVYWFGFEFGKTAIVTTLIVPNADTTWGCIRTSPQANAQVLSAIIGTPLILLGQAHSHPGDGVRHSETDDRETFASFDGAISVVVPNFGREKIDLETCGIHRHTAGAFQYIDALEIAEHIRVLPGEVDFRKKIAKGNSKN